ncbi:sirohydrochlorin chelatase [Alicyclobacillaceae bacterium I2511]|nr:sirohydrochlorin chelatase [Alicyclobacillaceae bacterium I2511]
MLIVGHGSRDTDSNQEFLDFVQQYRQRYGDVVEAGFLELAQPNIPQGIARCVQQGAQHVTVLPLILLAATHVKLEIPEYLASARHQYPEVEFTYGRNVGLHPSFIELAQQRFEAMPAALMPREGTGIVLMFRGSSDPDANGDAYKLSRLLWEKTGVATVETCFTGVTYPSVWEGVRRAAALGVKRIVIVPYFLFTGVLIKRVRGWLPELMAQYPQIPIEMAHYFGPDPRMLDIVAQVASEAVAGKSYMNCDFCQYRLASTSAHSPERANA